MYNMQIFSCTRVQETHTDLHVYDLKKATLDEDSKKLTRLETSMQTIQLFLKELHMQTQRLEDTKGERECACV